MQKIQLTIAIHFISFKNTDEEGVMHSKGDTIEIMSYDESNKVTEELIRSYEVLRHFFIGIKLDLKHQFKVVALSLIS